MLFACVHAAARDGVPFVGLVRHYHTPTPFTYIALGSLATSVRANFHGPDLEEVFEILQALRVLNGKQVD